VTGEVTGAPVPVHNLPRDGGHALLRSVAMETSTDRWSLARPCTNLSVTEPRPRSPLVG
jgi:hypothetical protein